MIALSKSIGVCSYQFEDVNNVLDSVDLIQMHRDEVEATSSDPFLPDRALYNELQAIDRLFVMTVRDGDVLIGYQFVIIDTSNHHPDTLQGVTDCVFIHPDHRNGNVGKKMMSLMDDYLREMGVKEMFHFVPTCARDWSPVLKRMGYKHAENIYCRSLL